MKTQTIGKMLCFFVPVLLLCSISAHAQEIDGRLNTAIQSGELSKVKKAVASGADINSRIGDNVTMLMVAIAEEKPTIARYLVEKGARVNDFDSKGANALMYAAHFGQIGTVKLLLGKGANIKAKSKDGWTPLMFAITGGKQEISGTTFKDEQGVERALNVGIRRCEVEMLKVLVKGGVDVNAGRADGKTALAMANENNVLKLMGELSEIVNYLKSVGAR